MRCAKHFIAIELSKFSNTGFPLHLDIKITLEYNFGRENVKILSLYTKNCDDVIHNVSKYGK